MRPQVPTGTVAVPQASIVSLTGYGTQHVWKDLLRFGLSAVRVLSWPMLRPMYWATFGQRLDRNHEFFDLPMRVPTARLRRPLRDGTVFPSSPPEVAQGEGLPFDRTG